MACVLGCTVCGVGALLRARVGALVATDRAFREWLCVYLAFLTLIPVPGNRAFRPMSYQGSFLHQGYTFRLYAILTGVYPVSYPLCILWSPPSLWPALSGPRPATIP